MAALTDLSYQQLLAKLPANSLVITGGKVFLDVGIATDTTADTLTDLGVIKLLSVLLEAALKAQQDANTSQVAGEKLAALTPPTYGGAINGYVPVTRIFVSRSELISATNIVGQIN